MIQNLSGYLFVPLTELEIWRECLLRLGNAAKIKGTILLSPEGINVAIAGTTEATAQFVNELHQYEVFETLTFKTNQSETIPFQKFTVKIKAEIIRFLQPDAIPLPPGSATHLSPQTLKTWIDEGRDITILDTRNDYEVVTGTFKDAVILPIHHFTQLPKAVSELPKETLEKPVVMFCTGGVRCEKAAPWLQLHGAKEVYQIDGGILNYFKECGDAHYQGECFVFDERIGITPEQKPSGAIICANCQFPVTLAQQQLPSFHQPDYCPHCVSLCEHGESAVIAREPQAYEAI
jgi:UPF0176 protein